MAQENIKIGCSGTSAIYTIIAVITAMIGYQIHGSVGWAILDFIFWPWCWIKWLIFHEVNVSIIRETFSFFLQ